MTITATFQEPAIDGTFQESGLVAKIQAALDAYYLRGYEIDSTPPEANQVPHYNATTGKVQWVDPDDLPLSLYVLRAGDTMSGPLTINATLTVVGVAKITTLDNAGLAWLEYNPSTGAITMRAGGLNQNITLNPSGSGDVVLNGDLSTAYWIRSLNFDASGGGARFLMGDNLGAALDFREGVTPYLRFVTTNGAEAVEIGATGVTAIRLQGNTRITESLAISGTSIDDNGRVGVRTAVDSGFDLVTASRVKVGSLVLGEVSADFDQIQAVSANGLKIVGPITVTGAAGFNGAAALAKPTITGSKNGNAALTSLITELANYGLVTDGTT